MFHVSSTNASNPQDCHTIFCWNARYIVADNRAWFSQYNMYTPLYVEWTNSSLIFWLYFSSYPSWTMSCCELTKFFLQRHPFIHVQTCSGVIRHVRTCSDMFIWQIHYNHEIMVIEVVLDIRPGLKPACLSNSMALNRHGPQPAWPSIGMALNQHGPQPAWPWTINLLTTAIFKYSSISNY